ncbi:MAG TPA: HEAT repeat domain-containing protein [Acidimicrobiales bacterium]|nr:HEAT repeat domain-containing protein [Acidimicrobiales bacterium]
MEEFDILVEELAVEHRWRDAYRRLCLAESHATPAVRRGLQHADPRVRVRCCLILDHFLDEAALPELKANLDHPDEHVRTWAMHALACDRCKEGECRPAEDDVVPIAIRMLREDPSVLVRRQAAGMLGPAVHRRDDVVRALVAAKDDDADPTVRKIAGWWAPGGPRFLKTAPRSRAR